MVLKDYEIKAEYARIMAEEMKLASANFPGTLTGGADEIYSTTLRILEFAKSSALPRSYGIRYGMTSEKEMRVALESVGAHANLAGAMLEMALRYWYGPGYGPEILKTINGYTVQEVMEAMRLHDLPENEIGDIPDNGARDEDEKSAREREYFQRFMKLYQPREKDFAKRVMRLLVEMDMKSTETGRMVYVADKASALIMTLVFDLLGNSPKMHVDDPEATERDKIEMAICDGDFDGYRRASEMWTIGYFKIRETQQYDDTGFFTAVIVMMTLIVNGRWYSWREKDYNSSTPC